MSWLGIRIAATIPTRSCSFAGPARLLRLARHLHNRRPLPYPIEDGVNGFLSPDALRVIAVEYQDGLLERLNDEVRGTGLEHKSVVDTVIHTATDRSKALAFNYASQALNNSYFLNSIKPLPKNYNANSHEQKLSSKLMAMIREQYSSLGQLQSNFSAAVLGLVSSGWIWFVADSSGLTAILPTFGAGTLLVRSRHHMAEKAPILGEDEKKFHDSYLESSPLVKELRTTPNLNLPSSSSKRFTTQPTSPASGTFTGRPPSSAPNSTSSHSLHTDPSHELSTRPPNFYDVPEYDTPELVGSHSERLYGHSRKFHPLFCVSVHEHAWMSAGYGVWGKEEYMRRFWTVVDWEKVSRTYDELLKIPQK